MDTESSGREAGVELKTLLGALIFTASRPLSVSDMRKCLKEAAEKMGRGAGEFGRVRESALLEAVDAVRRDIAAAGVGLVLNEIAGGFRFESDPECGAWLRYMLDVGKPNRLSRPALETLAVIAYRQPVTRGEIESVRGVTVDHVLKSLMEMQLVKIVGRSELPGRPFLYGTTQMFLEHFGLSGLSDLSNVDPSLWARGGGAGGPKGADQAVEPAPKGTDPGTPAPEPSVPTVTAPDEPEAQTEDTPEPGEDGTEALDEVEENDEVDDDEDDEDLDDDDEDDDDDDDDDEEDR